MDHGRTDNGDELTDEEMDERFPGMRQMERAVGEFLSGSVSAFKSRDEALGDFPEKISPAAPVDRLEVQWGDPLGVVLDEAIMNAAYWGQG